MCMQSKTELGQPSYRLAFAVYVSIWIWSLETEYTPLDYQVYTTSRGTKAMDMNENGNQHNGQLEETHI